MKKFLFFLVFIFLLLLAVGIVGEATLRLLGFKPDISDPRSLVRVVPGGKYYRADDYLGYTHLPGSFRVSLPTGYSFQTTHDSNTLRITHPSEEDYQYSPKDKLWIFGCSVTHGWSINDRETYPWKLQKDIPGYDVVNYGVSGYGTIHSLLQLERDLKTKRKPKIVILAYMSMHDARNTLTASRRKAATVFNFLGPVCQPYASLDKNGLLVISRPVDVVYHKVPFNTVSALIHFLERAFNTIEAKFSNSHEVTRAIISEMETVCRKDSIVFILAGIDNDRLTHEMLDYFRGKGVLTIDISLDNRSGKFSNLPFDAHPNGLANTLYAQKLADFIKQKNLIKHPAGNKRNL
jgi:hypothetical protein